MANNNYILHSAAEGYTIEAAIKGQTSLVFYDSLRQAAMVPELRQKTIMPYKEQTPEALFSQWAAAMKQDSRTVKAREFWWTEYGAYGTNTFQVQQSGGGVPGPGVAVTVSLDTWSMSKAGFFSKPGVNFYAYIKGLNQKVKITAKNENVDPNTVTLEPINNEVLDLTVNGNYTLVMDPLQHVPVGIETVMHSHGEVNAPPLLWQGYVQEFEDSISLHAHEIDNYIYDRDFKIAKGLDAKGEEVWMYYIPYLNRSLETRVTDSKTINAIWGLRDRKNQIGLDGMVPQAEKYGMFNAAYDVYTKTSFEAFLFNAMKILRKIQGCKDYMLMHDWNFWIDWSKSLADSIKAADQSYRYALFGDGGEGARMFDYYSFKNFEAFGYKFVPYMLDAFDHRRYGSYQENFALMLPMAEFTDIDGARVPIFTYTYLVGAEPARVDHMWIDDARERRERFLYGNVQTSFGHEIHALTRLGTIKKAA